MVPAFPVRSVKAIDIATWPCVSVVLPVIVAVKFEADPPTSFTVADRPAKKTVGAAVRSSLEVMDKVMTSPTLA